MTKISSARLDMEKGRIDQAVLKRYAEKIVGGFQGVDVGSTYTADLSQGNVFYLTLTANCTFTFSNPFSSGIAHSFTIILQQDGAGSRTVTWPASVVWPGGTAPTLTSTPFAFDVYNFVTLNGGTTWAGSTAGQNFTINQTLWGWGHNNFGQLAQNIANDTSSPVQVGTLSTWMRAAAGAYHLIAVDSSNRLWSTGDNGFGPLGLGDNTNRSSSTQVGTLATWTAVASGVWHNIAQKKDGSLWAMGLNDAGMLGVNDSTNRNSPVQIGTLTTWSKFAASWSNTTAIKSDGSLWSWGVGGNGANGLNDTVTRSSPVQVGTLTNWSYLATSKGTQFTFAIKSDNSLWGWGITASGELGFGDTKNRSSPTQVGTLATWSQVSMGRNNVVALKTDGTIWTWGSNAGGVLGWNSALSTSSPVQVGTLTSWLQVAAADRTAAALRTDGTLWTWGYNRFAGLGQGDTVARSSPTIVGTLTSWAYLAPMWQGFFAQRFQPNPQNFLFAWGLNSSGQSGDNTVISKSSPVQVGTLSTWTSFSMGRYHSVAVKTDNTLWSWGSNTSGGLGLGDNLNRSSPVQVGTLATWRIVAAGGVQSTTGITLAIDTNGKLWSWGRNPGGYLGVNDILDRSSPVQVGTLATWSKVFTSTMPDPAAIDTSNNLWVWGLNAHGELGVNDTINRSSPTQIGTLAVWSTVGLGTFFGVGIDTSAKMWSWGRQDSFNYSGVLGLGDTINRSSPVQIGTLANWTSVVTGQYHTLALNTSGQLWSWGLNTAGQLGQGDTVRRSSPVQVGTLANWSTLVQGGASYHSFATKTDGTVWGWGQNTSGQLGLGDAANRSSPVQVGTVTSWQVARGKFSSLGLQSF
jgi:alpha-tubulin suppressor-like RCC1 family protein